MTRFTSDTVSLIVCCSQALDREQVLQSKMEMLQNILDCAQAQAASSWRSLVEEDRLLGRIESLQFKLESLINSTTLRSEDQLITSLRNELIKMHEERETYEIIAKESLQRATQQTLISAHRLSELEVLLRSAEEERDRCKDDSEAKATEVCAHLFKDALGL